MDIYVMTNIRQSSYIFMFVICKILQIYTSWLTNEFVDFGTIRILLLGNNNDLRKQIFIYNNSSKTVA